MSDALAHHWPEMLMEGGLLGAFMISACVFATILEHPASRARQAVRSGFRRRAWMGAAMGLTAVALIYSPWGEQSGAHLNPAVTLTFLSLGKVKAWDALFYIVAQFIGGAAGVAVSRVLLGDLLKHENVDHVVTQPGRRGAGVAWSAELAIAFIMMLTVLGVANDARLAPYTGGFAGALVALYIAFEAPLSGMSLNPARTFASAVIARRWRAAWVYFTAPVAGMMLASLVYTSALPGNHQVHCAKLDHCNNKRCIFNCAFKPRHAVPTRQSAGSRGQE